MCVSLLIAASIALVSPENGATYDTHSPCVNEFLANFEKRGEKPPRPALTEGEIKARDEQNAKYDEWVKAGKPKDKKVKPWKDRFNFYMLNDWTDGLMKRAAAESKTWKPFAWNSDFLMKEAKVEFSESADFAKPIVETVKSTKKGKKEVGASAIRPGYLKLGTKYFWRVSGVDESGAKVVSETRTFTTAAHPPRMLCDPAFNFRDMGGGVNADGVRIRQGLLYRGQAPSTHGAKDGLAESSAKAFYVDMLGLKTDLDLRSRKECEARQRQWGEPETSKIGLEHINLEIIPYHMHYAPNIPQFIRIFETLADESKYPMYFHCAVGSDRTGTIAFLVSGILGREDRYFYDDYELPSFNSNLPRFRYCRKGSEMFETFRPKAEGETIRGNVVKYLLEIGVKQEHIDAIRRIMLEK